MAVADRLAEALITLESYLVYEIERLEVEYGKVLTELETKNLEVIQEMLKNKAIEIRAEITTLNRMSSLIHAEFKTVSNTHPELEEEKKDEE